ncbi:hypothetical protein KO527_11015 [Pseudoalteromonas sp. C2R02]|uniref:hypothetical protein n=1 Tax=Pseudoalteromonas sp. C2R02 TaxID=2841565 RepID=UPI001C08474C|nr:hypothetical protein [Pseudoalteromonas sp. C2R02]MBU2969878.1 hypothetical protein [Pseudoalteromonas sp. C2R02]
MTFKPCLYTALTLFLTLYCSTPLKAESIPFKEIYAILGDFNVSTVKYEGVVDGSVAGQSVPEAIKLTIEGSSHCNVKFLAMNNTRVLTFKYLIKLYGGGILDNSCNNALEYIWTPTSKFSGPNEQDTHILEIGPMIKYDDGKRFEKYFIVSVDVNNRAKRTSTGRITGYYPSYSNIKIELDKEWIKSQNTY